MGSSLFRKVSELVLENGEHLRLHLLIGGLLRYEVREFRHDLTFVLAVETLYPRTHVARLRDWDWPTPTGIIDCLRELRPALIAKLDKPTALAFGKDGELYVTTFGTAREGATTKPGKLIKFAKGL